MTIHLSERLSLVASLCIPNLPTVDVGTDHAFLPTYLIQSGKIKTCIASDVADDPLENAQKTIAKYHLENKIKLIKSDGLKNISDDFSQVIVCGMGGTLIKSILNDEERTRKRNMHLILQPMTRAEEVREYLWCNGFEIKQEITVLDEGRVYVVLDVFYTGKNTEYTEEELYLGKILPKKTNLNSNDKKYMEKQTKILESKKRGELLRK